jgi:hypothetical protein
MTRCLPRKAHKAPNCFEFLFVGIETLEFEIQRPP